MLLTSVGASVLGLWLIRKFVPIRELTRHHEVVGALLSIIGTLYSITLGLIVVGSLNNFQNARVIVATEANCLHDIFLLSRGLPESIALPIRHACVNYADSVIRDEWKQMENGQSSSASRQCIGEICNTLVRYMPTNQQEADIHSSLLSELNTMEDNRTLRLTSAAPAFDTIIWVLLCSGAGVLIVFTYFFEVDRLKLQILMTSMVALVLSLNLIVIAMFGYPFSGDVKVSCGPFVSDLQLFRAELTK